jgi:hypothetical protein
LWEDAPNKANFLKIVSAYFHADLTTSHMDLDIWAAPNLGEKLRYSTSESEDALRRNVYDKIEGSGTIFLRPRDWVNAHPSFKQPVDSH